MYIYVHQREKSVHLHVNFEGMGGSS